MQNNLYDIYFYSLILILLLTIYRCHKKDIENFSEIKENPRIAIYGCNFGNFRGELNEGIDDIVFDSRIDYYFFTDNKDIVTKKWNKIIYNKVDGDNIMDSNRWSSKNVKFNLPEILKDYDIIVWYDSKIVNKRLRKMLNYDQIIEKVKNHKIDFFKHPDREETQQEIRKTIELNLENKDNGNKFLDEIKDKKFKVPLVDTCFVIRRNEESVNNLFKGIFDALKEKGLKRDQNVLSYVADKLSFPTDKINYSLELPRG